MGTRITYHACMPTGGFQSKEEQARLMRLLGLGLTFSGELVAGLLIGWGLDILFDTDRVFLIIGTILGLIVASASFFRAARKANREAMNQFNERKNQP